MQLCACGHTPPYAVVALQMVRCKSQLIIPKIAYLYIVYIQVEFCRK